MTSVKLCPNVYTIYVVSLSITQRCGATFFIQFGTNLKKNDTQDLPAIFVDMPPEKEHLLTDYHSKIQHKNKSPRHTSATF